MLFPLHFAFTGKVLPLEIRNGVSFKNIYITRETNNKKANSYCHLWSDASKTRQSIPHALPRCCSLQYLKMENNTNKKKKQTQEMKTCDFVKPGWSQMHFPKQRWSRRALPGPGLPVGGTDRSPRSGEPQRPRGHGGDRAGGLGPTSPHNPPLQHPASGNELQSERDNQSTSGGTPNREAAGTKSPAWGCAGLSFPRDVFPHHLQPSTSFHFRTLKFWLNLAYWFRRASPDLTEQSVLFSSATLYWLCRGAMTPIIGLTALWGHFVSDKIPTDPRRI